MSEETFQARCVCGWYIERDADASNLPRETNRRITKQVAEIHRDRPRFGDAATDTHELSGVLFDKESIEEFADELREELNDE